jgi:hypothetical protein
LSKPKLIKSCRAEEEEEEEEAQEQEEEEEEVRNTYFFSVHAQLLNVLCTIIAYPQVIMR